MKRCTQCGYEIDKDANFCLICGKKMVNVIICTECSLELNDSQKYCPKCGTKNIFLENEFNTITTSRSLSNVDDIDAEIGKQKTSFYNEGRFSALTNKRQGLIGLSKKNITIIIFIVTLIIFILLRLVSGSDDARDAEDINMIKEESNATIGEENNEAVDVDYFKSTIKELLGNEYDLGDWRISAGNGGSITESCTIEKGAIIVIYNTNDVIINARYLVKVTDSADMAEQDAIGGKKPFATERDIKIAIVKGILQCDYDAAVKIIENSSGFDFFKAQGSWDVSEDFWLSSTTEVMSLDKGQENVFIFKIERK